MSSYCSQLFLSAQIILHMSTRLCVGRVGVSVLHQQAPDRRALQPNNQPQNEGRCFLSPAQWEQKSAVGMEGVGVVVVVGGVS